MKVVWYKVKVILVILIGLHTFSLPGYTQQQSDLVTASAEVIVRASTTFLLDGTDPGWGMKSTETINLGMVDSRGTPIAGVQSGHPDVNGIVGIPVNSGGSPISSLVDPSCIGAFYPFFSLSGGNKKRQHPNSAIAIFLKTSNPWRISVSAQLLTSSINVTVNQLKWKMDESPSNGFQGYNDFTTSENIVASGMDAWDFFYIDFGLLVEHEDGPGFNTWLITYTLISE